MTPEPLISIAILSSVKIEFELYGDYRLSTGSSRMSGKFTATYENEQIKFVQSGKPIHTLHELILLPGDVEIASFVIHNVKIGKEFHWERNEDQRFHGSLRFIVEDNKLTAINIVPIEYYIESVISSEMNANSPFEFLKAHAVISRSWALHQIQQKNNPDKTVHAAEHITNDELIKWYDRASHTNYDLCADDHCQRYQGVTKIINDRVLAAVEATHGLVIKYNDEVCDARFSKCCGGISESFENTWEPVEHPYLSPVYDYKYEQDIFTVDFTKEQSAKKWIMSYPQCFCHTNDNKLLYTLLPDYDFETKNFFRWNVEYDQDELAELINSKSGIDFGHIMDLIPVQRGKSSRIIKLRIVGSKKTMVIGKELEIRKILSKSHLFSSAFIVEKEDIADNIPGRFILYGAGWGHGVGLCQIGAAVMSSSGYRFDEILSHYYRNSVIHKMY